MNHILHHKQYGTTGEPIIILHGLFGMLDNWVSIAKKLFETHTVYLVDQRNHGKSFHSDTFDYHTLADDLRAWMSANEIQSAHLIGHSMGGKTVMQFAQDYTQLCKSIMILDIAPRQYSDGHSAIFDAILSLDLTQVKKRADADDMLAGRIDNWGVRQFLLKNLSRDGNGGFGWKANFKSLHDNYHNIKAPIELTQPSTLPALLIAGTKSDYIESSDIEDLRRYFTDAKQKTLDAGHWVHAERPAELIEIINDYIN